MCDQLWLAASLPVKRASFLVPPCFSNPFRILSAHWFALCAAFCALHSRVFCSGIIPRRIETVDAELEGLHGVYSGDIRRQGVLKQRT